MGGRRWTQEEDDRALDLAGEASTKNIAQRLGRTRKAVRDRITRTYGLDNRDASGHLTMAECAREYGCPESRVRRLIRTGALKAHRMRGAHFWRIDPEDAAAITSLLRAPRVTWKAG